MYALYVFTILVRLPIITTDFQHKKELPTFVPNR